MNGPIVRVFGVVLVLFALLAFFTARWTIIDRSKLQDNPQNKRALLAQEKIARGAIFAGDGTTLARSVRAADGTYTRRYPQQSLFSHAVGYAYLIPGTAGLEQFYNGTLIGRSTRPGEHAAQAAGQGRAGQRPAHLARPARAAGRAAASLRRPSGRGRRARPAHRPRARDGLDPELRPQRAAHREGDRGAEPRARRPAAQPQHAGPLPAGLDDEGRHVDRRDRHRAATRRTRSSTGRTGSRSPACR